MELVIDGRYQSNHKDARRLVILAGVEHWLRQREYNTLVKLLPPQRWVVGRNLVNDWREFPFHKIHTLRQALPVEIRNNGQGAYMLVVDWHETCTVDCDAKLTVCD
jgi:hypothetical protein